MKYILGIDIGGTFTKAALFDLAGRQISVGKSRTQAVYGGGGRAERDLPSLKEGVFDAIRELIVHTGVLPDDVAAIGLSGHGKGLYTLDRSGKEFTNGILSVDSRARQICDRMLAGEAGRYVRERHYQNLLACQPVCLLRWLKENEPAVYQRIGTVFSAKDYVRYCLTGKIAAEKTDLSGTNLFDPDAVQYDFRILELFGIEEMRGCLPPVISSFETAGFVTAEAASRTGLKEGTPVVGGMFDIDACALAAGMTDETAVAMIAGTWAINEYLSKTPVTGEDAPMNSLYCLDGYYLAEECSPTSSGNLQWWMEKINPSLTYEDVNRLVAEADPRREAFFIPYATGNAFGANSDGVFAGLNQSCGKGEMLRAIYEGVVFHARIQLDRLLRFRKPPECIRLAGGVTNSAVWVQLFADILQLPVEIPENAGCELGCFGAAVAAGAGTGILTDVKSFLSSIGRKRIEPDLAAEKIYGGKYARFKRLLEAVKQF